MRKRTSNNYTYNMGSHVLQFGALSIDEEPAADYLGELNTGGATFIATCPARRRLRTLAPFSAKRGAALPWCTGRDWH